MLRSLPLASAPSATIQVAPCWTPASRSRSDERHAGPLAAARRAVRGLDALRRGRAPLQHRVALALEEEDARRRGQAPDLLHGQDHRTIDQAVDQETVLARVDVGNTAAVDLVVERRRRDDPQRFVQGRDGAADFVRLRQGELLPDGLLEARAFAVGPDGAAEDLRRIVGRRLRPTRDRAPSPGDQRCTEGGTAFQEPAAAGGLPGGFGVRSWIAHRCLLGRRGRVSYRGRSPLVQGVWRHSAPAGGGCQGDHYGS